MRVTNKITFEAKDDAEALRIASERLGRDAVVLSSRPVKIGGMFGLFRKNALVVSAGVLVEEETKKNPREKNEDDGATRERLAAFQKLLEIRQATEMKNQPTHVAPTISASGDTYHPTMQTTRGQTAPNISGLAEIKGEIETLSERLAQVMKKLEAGASTPTEKLRFADDAHSEIYKKLIDSEMSEGYASRLLDDYANDQKNGQNEKFVSWLSKKVNIAAPDPVGAIGGRRIAFIGPTGVGKTTTIAKLAAIFSLWEHKKVLLLTSDTYRIAAVEQLRSYAKILRVPIEVVFEPESVNKILVANEKADIVLMDTAGRNQKDVRHVEAFRALFGAYNPDAVHLVLSANMKSRDMFDVIDRVSSLAISHLIFTKLDETTDYGALFDVSERVGKPFSFFTAGQNVPNDIEVASGETLCKLLLGGA